MYMRRVHQVQQMYFEEQSKLRERRHDKLMKMIRDYQLEPEQRDYLQTIKRNTEIEIASRFARSKHNKSYKFPLKESQSDEEVEDFPRGVSFDHSTYDLKAQNYIRNSDKTISKTDGTPSRRVKSLGQQKFDEKMMQNIRQELRERPKERGSRRQRLMFPELNNQIGSHKVLKTEQTIKSRQFSLKLLRNKNIQAARQQLSKQKRQKKIGQVLGSKLLTQGGDIISFGQAKVMINKLRIVSPAKKVQRGRH